MEKGLVGVPTSQHCPRSIGRPVEEGQVEHGLHALGGAAGAVKGVAGPKEGGGVVLTLQDNALRMGEVVGTSHLGDVQSLAAQRSLSLVPGHVEPGRVGSGIAAHEVTDGGVHG